MSGLIAARACACPAELVLPATLLAAVFTACFVWPHTGAVPAPTGGDVLESNLPLFAAGHTLGTDMNGNDVWSRLLHGGRASLQIALAVNMLGLVIGGFTGAFSAQAGGMTDAVVMRVLDALIAFPALVLVVAVAQALGPGPLNTIAALSLFSIPGFARVARAATLRLRGEPFMLAAELCGTHRFRTLCMHAGPNILPVLLSYFLLGMGLVVIVEGALSYLGLGMPPPHPTWGNMIAHGHEALAVAPRLVVLPSACLFVTALSFNLLGEGARARWGNAR